MRSHYVGLYDFAAQGFWIAAKVSIEDQNPSFGSNVLHSVPHLRHRFAFIEHHVASDLVIGHELAVEPSYDHCTR